MKDRRRGGKAVLTLLHPERPKLYAILACLSAIGLRSGQGWTLLVQQGLTKTGLGLVEGDFCKVISGTQRPYKFVG